MGNLFGSSLEQFRWPFLKNIHLKCAAEFAFFNDQIQFNEWSSSCYAKIVSFGV